VRRRVLVASAVLATSGLLAGCGGAGSPSDRETGSAAPSSPAGAPTTTLDAQEDLDTPTGWGPTVGELAEAGRVVDAMDDDELAGRVIVGRYAGTDPAVPAALVGDLHLAGVSVTNDNVLDADQVRATTEAVREAADGPAPPVIGIDQEGGVVSHLRGVATDFPAFADAGLALAADDAEGGSEGTRSVRRAARATGLELRDLGFSWVFAPVADVTVGDADPTIGSRSASEDPDLAGRAVAAAVSGYGAAGVVSTTKHFPGHGAATADSHVELPVLDESLRELRRRDLPPFRRAVERGAPAVMVAHLDIPALDPGVPTSLSPAAYRMLRDDLGFEGVAITDSLGMGAVAEAGFPAVRALSAGADLLLMPVDTRETHRVVVEALADGDLDRDRVREAATRVVALQLWQERVSGEHPVRGDVEARAQRAASALEEAAAR